MHFYDEYDVICEKRCSAEVQLIRAEQMFTERDYLENFLYVFNKFIGKTVECGSFNFKDHQPKRACWGMFGLRPNFFRKFLKSFLKRIGCLSENDS